MIFEDRVLNGFNFEEFKNEIYAKKCHLFTASACQDAFFDIGDFNSILNHRSLTYPRVRVVNRNNSIQKRDIINDIDRYRNNVNNEVCKKRLIHKVADGGTLIFDKIQRESRVLDSFINSITDETSVSFSLNGYFTNSNAYGVNPHFDQHDVFAMQIHGSKTWYYSGTPGEYITSISHQSPPAKPEEWSKVTLKPGDVFYVPRGVWHYTKTTDETSLHLALGAHPVKLRDWLKRLESIDTDYVRALESYVQNPFESEIDPETISFYQSKLNSIIENSVSLGLNLSATPKPSELIELD